MDSSAGKVIYCCVCRNSKILYSYNGGDHTLETLAAQCLLSAPAYHSHYLHSAGTRTFAFYWDKTETYFAILDPNRSSSSSSSGSRILKLLRQVREGFRTGSGDELAAVIRRLVDSMEESMSRHLRREEEEEEERNGLSGDGSSSTKALLTTGGNGNGNGNGEEIMVEVTESTASSSRDLLLLQKRRLWWRHFKIVVAVDAGVCLALFGIWLAVCRGLQCVT